MYGFGAVLHWLWPVGDPVSSIKKIKRKEDVFETTRLTTYARLAHGPRPFSNIPRFGIQESSNLVAIIFFFLN